jgi:SAM-dependent methyltransferase
MHDEARKFLEFVASQTKRHFTQGKVVLDVGSGDVNGTNEYLFDPSCLYHGNDVMPGRNVTLMYKTAELPFYEPTFDTIISSECFQHDLEYKESLQKIVQILRPGGLFVFTCASGGRPEHGTRRHNPEMSFTTKLGPKWASYYKTLSFEDLNQVLDLNSVFSQYAAYYDPKSKDLYFMGLKKDVKRPGNLLPLERYRDAEILVSLEIPARSGFFDVVAPAVVEPPAETVKESPVETVISDLISSIVEEPPTVVEPVTEPLAETVISEPIAETVNTEFMETAIEPPVESENLPSTENSVEPESSLAPPIDLASAESGNPPSSENPAESGNPPSPENPAESGNPPSPENPAESGNPAPTLEQLAYDDLLESEKAVVETYLRQIGQIE